MSICVEGRKAVNFLYATYYSFYYMNEMSFFKSSHIQRVLGQLNLSLQRMVESRDKITSETG